MSLQEAERRIAECRETQNPVLDLSNLRLNHVPTDVFELSHLTYLNLGGWTSNRNQLQILPNEIHKLKNLQRLDLSDNALTSLPDIMGELINLQKLELSSNQLNNLPETFAQLANLKQLYLRSNRLNRFPTVINKLTSLTQLYLGNNRLYDLPSNIAELDQLQIFDLHDNQLEILPDELGQLNRLAKLSLFSNRLHSLPETIGQLTSLQAINLCANQICLLPKTFDQLINLQKLYLNENQFSAFPELTVQLTQLQQLHLSGNQISFLPNSIASLINLRRLSLSDNQLCTIPDTVSNLINLTQLYLGGNRFSDFPEVVVSLNNLQVLDLQSNYLVNLPSTITQIASLQRTYFADNPLENPPLEVAVQGISAISTYFSERMEQTFHEVGLYESKLLLIGEGRVGKTSISKALRIHQYKLEDEQSTEGIDIQTWMLPRTETGLEEDFRLNVWDFGGQEIYHATHQFFLTRRSLYLLVTESRREDTHDDFYYWFNIVRLLGNNAPIILVLNKCDQPTKELPVEGYRKSFNNLIHYEKVSCLPEFSYTVENLRAVICRTIANREVMPQVGDRIPSVWLDIRRELIELRENGLDYISFQDLLSICMKYNVVKTERVSLMIGYFHDLGILLHFRDDIELRDTVILNHEWITRGVYKVLDNQAVKEKQGHFTDEDLYFIWSEKAYINKQHELLALMKNTKFELCYELPAKSGQRQGYLAPQLLPVDEIEYKWRNDRINLCFEYRYDFMPKGILSRFIVKRHREIVQSINKQEKSRPLHWRYGALLEWDNTRALVRERYFERKITIALEGDNKIGFLAIIRRSIEEIHDDFHNLAVHEMVPCNCAECCRSSKPHFFRHELLEHYLRRGRYDITCEVSLEDVDVRSLLRETFLPEIDREEGDHYHVYGDLIWGDKVGADKIGGHKAGGDLIDVGDIQDASDIAIGRNKNMHSEGDEAK